MNHLLELITPSNVYYNFHADSKDDVIRKLVKFGISSKDINEEYIDEINANYP
jgi:mannitol/fructose-specific phosphotransferase system IIA component (Ntr-type)